MLLEQVFLRSEIRERRGWGKVLAAKIESVTWNFDQTLKIWGNKATIRGNKGTIT